MNRHHYELTKKFWNGENNGTTLSIDKNGISVCLIKALGDFTARTEKRISARPLGPNDMYTILCTSLHTNPLSFLDEFEEYFDQPLKNESDFDKWHHKMCRNTAPAGMLPAEAYIPTAAVQYPAHAPPFSGLRCCCLLQTVPRPPSGGCLCQRES